MKMPSNMLLCLSLSSVFFVVSISSAQAKTPKKYQTVKRFCPPILKKKNIKALISNKSNQGYNPYKTKNVNKGFYLSLNNKFLDVKKLKSLKSAELISINEDAIKMLCRLGTRTEC
ncbi:MAG TPA: hypothetical protein DD412_00765 [Holosporales bacterium]|nr:hypothetical protein [Holosporales bacterium]